MLNIQTSDWAAGLLDFFPQTFMAQPTIITKLLRLRKGAKRMGGGAMKGTVPQIFYQKHTVVQFDIWNSFLGL